MHEAKRQRQKKIAERTNLRKQVCCHSLIFGSFDYAIMKCRCDHLFVVVVDIICEQTDYSFKIENVKELAISRSVGRINL